MYLQHRLGICFILYHCTLKHYADVMSKNNLYLKHSLKIPTLQDGAQKTGVQEGCNSAGGSFYYSHPHLHVSAFKLHKVRPEHIHTVKWQCPYLSANRNTRTGITTCGFSQESAVSYQQPLGLALMVHGKSRLSLVIFSSKTWEGMPQTPWQMVGGNHRFG